MKRHRTGTRAASLEAAAKRYRIGADKIRESVRAEFEAKGKKQEDRRKVSPKAKARGKQTAT